MDREKFQQKALKQTKQKKSKSAEFLMGKDERAATEGIANPAFNISSADLSAYQASEEEVIRGDKRDRTLAAHQQKLRLQARAEPRGNECSRNYFDPLMDEEINPRQCGMEVSKEVPDERLFYDKLMLLLDEEDGMLGTNETHVEENHDDVSDSVCPTSYTKTCQLCEELEDEGTVPYIEQFEKDVQDEIIHFANSSLEQGTKKFSTGLSKISQSKEKSQVLKAAPNAYKEGTAAKFGNLVGVNNDSNGAAGLCWKVDWSKTPQPIQIQLKCLRGVKDKVPQGSYVLKVSLHGRLGGKVLRWANVELQQCATTTLPVRHNGNFYDVEICFDQSVHTDAPARKDGKPGEILLFELFLLRGTNTCIDRVVGWGAFPLRNNHLDTVEGKFKCPFLRGHYNSKIDRFQKIENLISSDLDHWLCNLYFQIIKLPRYSDEQKGYEAGLQVSSSQLAYSSVTEKDGISKQETEGGLQDEALKGSCLQQRHPGCSLASLQGNDDLYKMNSSYSDKFGDMVPVKEARSVYFKNEPDNEYGQRSPRIGLDTDEAALYSTSYLEELEKHRFSVRCPPSAETRTSKRITKHMYLGVCAAFSELGRGQWFSWDFWYILLLVALLWFFRLYLHYCGQWVLLQAVAVPVTKFQFYPHTVELCYQNSLVHASEELAMVVVGPLTLNTVMLLVVLTRWGCQVLFGSLPSYLSKLIMAWGLWTVLDPLAVFIVDAFLGRLHYSTDKPIADCAKLYWLFLRMEGSGIPGALITVLLYVILFIMSSTVLYLYFIRIHNEGWLLDIFQRIQSDEATFFVPFDLEISNQELSYIVKKAEQWRGINGERRKVVVYDYIWKDHANKSCISSSDAQHQGEILKSVGKAEGTTVHVAIYTVHLAGFQELYRHFLRLPNGAIVEAFGDISGINFVYNEVSTVIQEHVTEMDNALEASSEIKRRERKKNTARWKGEDVVSSES